MDYLKDSKDDVEISTYLREIEYGLGEIHQGFKNNDVLRKYGYYFVHQLYLNALMHVNVQNLLVASDNNKDERKHKLQRSKDLYTDYKSLINDYADKAHDFRMSKILDVSCDCNPCDDRSGGFHQRRRHTYWWKDEIAMTDRISEYAQYNDDTNCDADGCYSYTEIEGERTNGLDLRDERNSYYNQMDP
jgi:hypothetical protein